MHDAALALHTHNCPLAFRLFDAALDALPSSATEDRGAVHNNYAGVLSQCGERERALAAHRTAAQTDAANPALAYNLASSLLGAPGDAAAAAEAYTVLEGLVARHSDYAPALARLARLYAQRGAFDSSVALYARALAREPRNPAWHIDRADALLGLDRVSEALTHARTAEQLQPDAAWPLVFALHVESYELEWATQPEGGARHESRLARAQQLTAEELAAGDGVPAISPMRALLFMNQSLLAAVAQRYAALTVRRAQPWQHLVGTAFEDARGRRWRRGAEPLRLGYVSADWGAEHPMAHLMRGLFAAHDRARVRVHCYALLDGPAPPGAPVHDIAPGCDVLRQFNVGDSDGTVATAIGRDALHVLVDLSGFTGLARPELFALRLAPLQLSHLGWPSSSGAASYMDAALVDATVCPPAIAASFAERVLHHPSSMFLSSHATRFAGVRSTRLALPLADGERAALAPARFVLCNFNQLVKIDPAFLRALIAILRGTPASVVLWLLAFPAHAAANLAGAFAREGLADRVVFGAFQTDKAQHLARLAAHCDLALDPFQYAGGASAVDMLWAGVPILTRLTGAPDERLVQRMAASVLRGAGVTGELEQLLLAPSAEAYVARAIALATDEAQAARLTSLVAEQLSEAALQRHAVFNVSRWAREFEGVLDALGAELLLPG